MLQYLDMGGGGPQIQHLGFWLNIKLFSVLKYFFYLSDLAYHLYQCVPCVASWYALPSKKEYTQGFASSQ